MSDGWTPTITTALGVIFNGSTILKYSHERSTGH
jgi:hypothetical protein